MVERTTGQGTDRKEGILRDPEQLWVGNNISTAENGMFAPHATTMVGVTCNTQDFPDSRLFSLQDIRRNGFLSFRSRYAQLGLHTDSSVVMNNALSRYQAALASRQDRFNFEVPVSNLSGAPIVIQKDTGLARFYMQPEEFVKNSELRSLMQNQIIIDGKEGRDWAYYREPNMHGIPQETGIMLRIKDQGRLYIPEGDEPILLANNPDNDYRAEVGRFLQPVERLGDYREPILWIGETAPIALGDTVTAIIDKDTYPTSNGRTPNITPSLHIESRLIDPGSIWPIRIEVFSPIRGRDRANWTVFRIYHQSRIAA